MNELCESDKVWMGTMAFVIVDEIGERYGGNINLYDG